MRIRPATPADMPRVVELMRELAAFEKLQGPDDEAAARLAIDAFQKRLVDIGVAEVEGEVVAYAGKKSGAPPARGAPDGAGSRSSGSGLRIGPRVALAHVVTHGDNNIVSGESVCGTPRRHDPKDPRALAFARVRGVLGSWGLAQAARTDSTSAPSTTRVRKQLLSGTFSNVTVALSRSIAAMTPA